jgi:hypothetical protein
VCTPASFTLSPPLPPSSKGTLSKDRPRPPRPPRPPCPPRPAWGALPSPLRSPRRDGPLRPPPPPCREGPLEEANDVRDSVSLNSLGSLYRPSVPSYNVSSSAPNPSPPPPVKLPCCPWGCWRASFSNSCTFSPSSSARSTVGASPSCPPSCPGRYIPIAAVRPSSPRPPEGDDSDDCGFRPPPRPPPPSPPPPPPRLSTCPPP